MEKSAEEIISRLKVIRETVKRNNDLAHDYWFEYHDLAETLKKIDPYNPELNIGIHDKPYFAGLKD